MYNMHFQVAVPKKKKKVLWFRKSAYTWTGHLIFISDCLLFSTDQTEYRQSSFIVQKKLHNRFSSSFLMLMCKGQVQVCLFKYSPC